VHPKDIRAATMYEKGDLKVMIASVKVAIDVVEVSFGLWCTSSLRSTTNNKESISLSLLTLIGSFSCVESWPYHCVHCFNYGSLFMDPTPKVTVHQNHCCCPKTIYKSSTHAEASISCWSIMRPGLKLLSY